MKFKILKEYFLSRLFGREISNEVKKLYKLEPKYRKEVYAACDLVKQNTMLSIERLASLYDQVRFLESKGIGGSFVECGVWKGGAVGMMALANLKYGRDKRDLHLFDAFDDICEPNPLIDGKQAMEDVNKLMGQKVYVLSGKQEPIKGIYNSRGGHGTIQECEKLLVERCGYDRQRVYFHEGWFKDSIPLIKNEIDQIALLRIDADWYESTKIALDNLYDKVVKGGLIIFDDYGRYDGCRKAVDEVLKRKNFEGEMYFIDDVDKECRYVFKP